MNFPATANDRLPPSRRIGMHPTRPLRLALALVLVWGLAGGAHAQVTPWAADLEDGTFNEFSQANALEGTLTNVGWASYTGVRCAHATYNGSGRNGYTRGIFNPAGLADATAEDEPASRRPISPRLWEFNGPVPGLGMRPQGVRA